MYIRDLQYGKYTLWIDDPELYDRFLDFCEEYNFCWASGRPLSYQPPKLRNEGALVLYTFTYQAIGDTSAMFTWGKYWEEGCSDRVVKLSDMLDFKQDTPAVDMSDVASALIASFV